MSYGLRYFGPAGIITNAPPPEGAWLRAYDPEAHGGRGESAWTEDAAEALRFATQADAMACWRQTSTVAPRRPDGKPNRPLTAYTMTVEEIPA